MNDNTRDIVLKTRANTSESDKFRRAAALLGLPLSAFTRLALNEKADRMHEHGKPPKRRKEGAKCGPSRVVPGRRASVFTPRRV